MDIVTLLTRHMNIKDGDFSNLKPFSFNGVYILCDEDGEVVYIGSSYPKTRTIAKRLRQYLNPNDTGNTLGKTIAKELANREEFDDLAKEQMDKAIEKIKSFKIYAIEYNDLEYQLVEWSNPRYNKKGNKKD